MCLTLLAFATLMPATLMPAAQAFAQQTSAADVRLTGLEARNIGPATMSGRIVDLAVVASDPQVFYVASATGGVFKTEDNGITLDPVFENEPTHSVGDIAVHQGDTSIVWVGTGERASRQSSSWGDGVYRSDDGGATWTNMGLTDSKHIGRIVLHPTDTDLIYVAAMGHLWGPNEERGLYRSRDGGTTWEQVLAVDEDTGAVDVAMDPLDPNTLYAAMYQRRRRGWGFHGGGPGSGLYKSTDGGDSWTSLTNSGLSNGLPEGILGRIGISIYQSDPRIVYVSVEQGFHYNASTAYEERRAGIYRSEDGGASWEHMSDWNPRPMYASQILVDPSDDQRVYMVNAYSFSDDGGRTFTVPRQSLHGDDRLVWVNPQNSRHVMKADDGGLGISYDRGLTWLYISDLPVSQYYRVAVDMAKPYRVYGGLQDNGSWIGPSATYRTAGILNEDWIKVGGGDGFLNLPDTTTNDLVYTESQYLGLSRLDLTTGERTSIRPGDPTGHISGRRNWETWKDLSAPEMRLGNAMEPANWDGPFIISHHNSATIYAGTERLWKSPNRGNTWIELGNLTSGVDRRTLPIMGELPEEETLSLDDGIPYFPTMTAIAESPFHPGVLYVGTDDGQFQVSMDDGQSWTDVSDRFPGLPELAWLNTIEVSHAAEGRVYAVWNNYRNDDYGNYLYRSDDHGMSWSDITGDLPAERVLRAVREDPRNERVLYLGTELGLFYSRDAGTHWTELRGGLPTLAHNDLVVHPRDNDLITATHGRGVFIFDQINALQELTDEIMAKDVHVFTMEAAEQIRLRNEGAHTGDIYFRGDNPQVGALVDYWLSEAHDKASIAVFDHSGAQVATFDGPASSGLNRAVWDLRHRLSGEGSDRFGGQGPLVVPNTYRIVVSAGGATSESYVEVREDPRIQVAPAVRTAWTTLLLELSALRQEIRTAGSGLRDRVEDLDVADTSDEAVKLRDLDREFRELQSRVARVSGEISGVVAKPTSDQSSRINFYREMAATLLGELDQIR